MSGSSPILDPYVFHYNPTNKVSKTLKNVPKPGFYACNTKIMKSVVRKANNHSPQKTFKQERCAEGDQERDVVETFPQYGLVRQSWTY